MESQFNIDINRFMNFADKVRLDMLERIDNAHSPQEVRAAITLSTITSASVEAPVQPLWFDLIYKPILDQMVEDEIRAVNLKPLPPGGLGLNKLGWDRNLLRAMNSSVTPPGNEPSKLGKTDCIPKLMHSYMKIDEGALRSMMYQFNRSAFLRDYDAAEMAANALFIKTWLYATLASLMNLSWNGDTGGAAGLDMYDGWLKQIVDASDSHVDNTDGNDLLGTVFPSMWQNSGFDTRHLDTSDIVIYTSRQWAQKYKIQILENKLNGVGTWDASNNSLMYLNAKVVPMTDMPTTPNGSNVLAVLTRRVNMVVGIVDNPMTIRKGYIVSTGEHEFSSPIQAKSTVADTDVCVYWVPTT